MHLISTAWSTALLLATLSLLRPSPCWGVQEQIIGGTPAVAGEVPFLMQVLSGSTYLCIASLIHPSWAITYAYRIYRVQNITLRLSSLRTDGDYEPYRLELYVTNTNKTVFLYPGYAGSAMHSIAVIRMPYPITLPPSNVRPVRISTVSLARASEMSQTYVGVQGKLCGWGIYNLATSAKSPVLRCKESNAIISLAECNKTLGHDLLHEGSFCTLGDNVGCIGDGASPFLVSQRSGFKAIGTSAWVQADCGYGPEGYMKMAYYYNWIRGVTGNAV